MTWVLICLGVLLVVGLVRSAGADRSTPGSAPGRRVGTAHPSRASGGTGRAAAAAVPGALGAEVLRRATDPDDPDGAFMDGYVSGRLTERWTARDEPPPPGEPRAQPVDGDDEGDDDYGDHGLYGDHGIYAADDLDGDDDW